MAQSRQSKEHLSAVAVLATFVEALLTGRRIAVLGDSSDDVGEHLAAASGRRVHVFDPDARRAGTTIAARGGATKIAVAPLEGALEDHRGAFDAVLVPDLAELGDVAELLPQIAALVSNKGFLVLATSNPETTGRGSIGYYDLYDLVSEHFDNVSMHGKAPFSGFTVASFAVETEPAVTIDASLMTAAEEPRTFVAVASHAELELDPYLLVQVPHRDAPVDEESPDAEDPKAELVEAQLQRSLMSAELDKVRERESRARALASEREAKNKQLASRLAELESELDRERKRAKAAARDAEKETGKLERRLRQLQGELDERGSEAVEEALEAQRLELEEAHQEDLDRMLERIAELEEAAGVGEEVEPSEEQETPTGLSDKEARAFEFQLSELRAALEEARRDRDEQAQLRASLERRLERLAAIESELADAQSECEELRKQLAADGEEGDHAREVSALEAHLRDRGRVIEQQRRELRESERVGRELLSRLLAAESNGAPSDEVDSLRSQLEVLARRCSRYEADLQAASWQISSLSSSSEDEEATDVEKLELALQAAHQDLAELRRQLAKREESGGG